MKETTIKEPDAVALTCDLPEHRLARGDVGTAVPVPVSTAFSSGANAICSVSPGRSEGEG